MNPVLTDDALLSSPAFARLLADAAPARAELGSPALPQLRASDVASVERYTGLAESADLSCLDLMAVVRLTDGSYASVEAWADYSGWDCRGGIEVRVAPTLEQVVSFGLTRRARQHLGYQEVPFVNPDLEPFDENRSRYGEIE